MAKVQNDDVPRCGSAKKQQQREIQNSPCTHTRHLNPTNNAFIALEFCFIYDFLVYFVRVCTFRICHTQRFDGVF